ncbi:hypothetical protein KSS87_002979 [Heliosperma pusillum]|nr:hypothetical protein KSS87_002816 [Heliosperma pusillum]KAH9626104.1 hypothetical protein KSS87_002979 [Heliosperma pusillum]
MQPSSIFGVSILFKPCSFFTFSFTLLPSKGVFKGK